MSFFNDPSGCYMEDGSADKRVSGEPRERLL